MLFPTVSKDPLCLKEERRPESHHSTAWGRARWGRGCGALLPEPAQQGATHVNAAPAQAVRGEAGADKALSAPPHTESASRQHLQGGSLPGPGGLLGPRRVWNHPFQGTLPSRGQIPPSPRTARPAAGHRGAGLHRPSGTTVRTTPRVRAAPRTEGSPPRAPRKCHHPPPQRKRPRLRGTRCPRSLSCEGPSGHPDQAQEGCPHRATQPARGFPRLPGGAPPGRCPLPTPPLQGVEIPSSPRRRCPPPASATGFGFLASDDGTPRGLDTHGPAAAGTSWAGPATSLSPEGRLPRAG